MDSIVWIMALITVPFDLTIMLAGAYFIKAYAAEQALVRQAAHDEQITVRENLRLQGKLVDSGQYQGEQAGGLDSLIQQFAPLLLAKAQGQQPQAPAGVELNGKV